MRITLKNFAQLVCDACCIDGVPPLSYCKVCESLAVLSEGLSSKGACISFLRCSDVEVCCNCKKAARRTGSSFGDCFKQCASFRRCSKCDFFEYALGHFAPGCVSDKTAVVSVAQSSEGANRSLDFRYVYKRSDDPRCKSCALVHHGVNFVSLPTVLWAVPV